MFQLSPLLSHFLAYSTVFDGNLQLETQAKVNAINPNIARITGKIQIFGDNITDLTPLANITTVDGK
ncbi:hypothetical protein GCM10022258_19580 [Aquimarina gracilis]